MSHLAEKYNVIERALNKMWKDSDWDSQAKDEIRTALGALDRSWQYYRMAEETMRLDRARKSKTRKPGTWTL